MRTKTLVLTAALSVACAATTMAQVYSQNIVGYYQVNVPAGGLALLANQLNTPANSLGEVIPTAPDSSTVFVWNGAGFDSSLFIEGFGWDPERTLEPGDGFFFRNAGAAETTLTFVGEVPTGDNLSTTITPGLSLKGAIVPQAGSLVAEHNLPTGTDGDTIFQWAGTGYSPTSPLYIEGFGWDPDPVVAVGEGFFYRSQATADKEWTRTFNP